jgi:hypothetical protein
VDPRLLRYLLLIALMLAPFGRLSVAEAKAMPHHDMAKMASHCPDQPAPGGDKGGRASLDCMIACAAMISAPAAFILPSPPAQVVAATIALPILTGIRPEAEPPPPRLS